MNVAYNMDCLEAMRKMPDNAFDLAVVDPPYGSGLTEIGGCKGWFAKYHQDNPDNLGGGDGTDSDNDSTDTNTNRPLAQQLPKERKRTHYTFGIRKSSRNYQRRIEQGREISKKSFRGTLPRNRNILKNCFASHGTKLFGGAITSTFLRQGASSSLGKQTFPKRDSAWHPLNTHGLHFGETRRS